MQAVDQTVSKQITVTPNELPKGENIEFQVTSTRGVSFPKDDRTPTIVVQFGKPAEVQSVTIPRDKTPNANVQQFEVTFYGPNGKKINDKPILTNSSPKDDTKKPARLDSTQTPSNTPVSRLEITIVKTTDGESPKGVILDIQACTEITTGKCFSLLTTHSHFSFLISHFSFLISHFSLETLDSLILQVQHVLDQRQVFQLAEQNLQHRQAQRELVHRMEQSQRKEQAQLLRLVSLFQANRQQLKAH